MEPLKTPECKFPTNFPNFQIYKEIDFQSLYQKRDAEFKPNNSLQQKECWLDTFSFLFYWGINKS